MEMEGSINDLNDKFGTLNLELDNMKSIIIDAYQLSFNEAVRQSKHFFFLKRIWILSSLTF